jgi:hypothetical protein
LVEAAQHNLRTALRELADHDTKTKLCQIGQQGTIFLRNGLIISAFSSIIAKKVPARLIPPLFAAHTKRIPRSYIFVGGASLTACGAHRATVKLNQETVRLDYERKV